MKPIALIILLAFSTPLFAQNDTLIVNNDYKWKIGVKAMVERGNFIDWGLPYDTSPNDLFYNFGLQLARKVSITNFSIETGIFSLRRGFYYPTKQSYTENPTDSILIQTRKTFKNIHVPFRVKYDLNFIYMSLGFHADILYETNINDNTSFRNEHKNFENKISYGFNGNVGIEKNISNKFSTFIELEFSNNITTIWEGTTLSNAGLAFGINYKI